MGRGAPTHKPETRTSEVPVERAHIQVPNQGRSGDRLDGGYVFRTEARSATSLSPGGRALRMRGFAWRQGTSKRKDNIRKRFSSSGIAKIPGALHTGVFVLVLLPQPLNADLRAHLRAETSLRLTSSLTYLLARLLTYLLAYLITCFYLIGYLLTYLRSY